MPAGAQREAARRRQGEIVDNTRDKAQRARGETFLNGPQRLIAPSGFDQHHLLGVDAEARQTRRIKLAQLPAGMARGAPQECSTPSGTLGGGETATR